MYSSSPSVGGGLASLSLLGLPPMHQPELPSAHPCTQPSAGRLGRPGGTSAASCPPQSSAWLVACSRGTFLVSRDCSIIIISPMRFLELSAAGSLHEGLGVHVAQQLFQSRPGHGLARLRIFRKLQHWWQGNQIVSLDSSCSQLSQSSCNACWQLPQPGNEQSSGHQGDS